MSMSIGEIILTSDCSKIKNVEITEIGFKEVRPVRVEFDIDMLINDYSKHDILSHYISKGILHITCV